MILLALAASHAFTVLSPGSTSCGQWTVDHTRASGPNYWAEQSYVAGVLTGYNRYGPDGGGDVTLGVDEAGWTAWMNNYCATHPLEPIVQAVNELIISLKKARTP